MAIFLILEMFNDAAERALVYSHEAGDTKLQTKDHICQKVHRRRFSRLSSACGMSCVVVRTNLFRTLRCIVAYEEPTKGSEMMSYTTRRLKETEVDL